MLTVNMVLYVTAQCQYLLVTFAILLNLTFLPHFLSGFSSSLLVFIIPSQHERNNQQFKDDKQGDAEGSRQKSTHSYAMFSFAGSI